MKNVIRHRIIKLKSQPKWVVRIFILFGAILGGIFAFISHPIEGTHAQSATATVTLLTGETVSYTLNGDSGMVFTAGVLQIDDGATKIFILDRNLGATQAGTGCRDYGSRSESCSVNDPTYGYHFQRGNNYGFDPSMNPSIRTSQVESGSFIYNPLNQQYYSSSQFFMDENREYGNWLNDNSVVDLWGGNTEDEYIDYLDGNNWQVGNASDRQGPCPENFHVPSKGELDKIIDMVGSLNIHDDLLVPFAGERCDYDANFHYWGTSINLWSSSPSYTSVSRGFVFEPDGYYMMRYSRAEALSVRCVYDSYDTYTPIGGTNSPCPDGQYLTTGDVCITNDLDIVLQATATEANQTLKINKYFANAYTVDRGDGSAVQNLTADTTHTYATAGTYNIILSLAGTATRWTFQNGSKPLVPKNGTTMTGVKITYMPSLADGFGVNATNPGDKFFAYFNNSGAIISLPAESFDTSNITTVGNGFFDGFNQQGILGNLPIGSFRLSTGLTVVGENFFGWFNNSGALTSLPANSFNTNNISIVGNNFFRTFNQNGALTSLPVGSFDISNITAVGNNFFAHFNNGGKLTSLPVGSFNTSKISLVGDSFFVSFNSRGALTSLPTGSFNISNISGFVGNSFFYSFNSRGALTSLPVGSFKTDNITLVGTNFFASFNEVGKVTSLPEGSFNISNITGALGDYFFGYFNYQGKLASLPTGSFDTSNITTLGANYFECFNLQGKITSLPIGSFRFSSGLSTVGDNFFAYFNTVGDLTTLPEGSFKTENITTVGNLFFFAFNYQGNLASLPTGSFDTTNITSVGENFFAYFNMNGAIESLPEGSFDLSSVISAGDAFFYQFNPNGKLTNLPESFKLSSVAYDKTGGYQSAFNSPNYTLNKNVSDLVSGVTAPNSDRNTFSDNQPGRCGVDPNWLVTTADACSITYDSNGGSTIANPTQLYTADTTGVVAGSSITEPSRVGYDFNGWYTDPVGGSEVTTVSFPLRDGQTLYAQWVCADGYHEKPGVHYETVDEIGTITICDPNDSTKCITMMDKNLGATNTGTNTASSTIGNYYEWGNNYGFSSSQDPNTTSTKVPWDNKYNNSGYYGTVFIISRSEPVDYWSDNQNHPGLRGGANDLNDNRGYNTTNMIVTNLTGRQGPCPVGYHVPSAGEWGTLLEYRADTYATGISIGTYPFYNINANTSEFRNQFNLSMAGNLHNYYGSIVNVGNAGTYWTSSTSGSRAVCLNITNNNISIIRASFASGRPIRCFKDFSVSALSCEQNQISGACVEEGKPAHSSYNAGTTTWTWNSGSSSWDKPACSRSCDAHYHESGDTCELDTFSVACEDRFIDSSYNREIKLGNCGADKTYQYGAIAGGGDWGTLTGSSLGGPYYQHYRYSSGSSATVNGTSIVYRYFKGYTNIMFIDPTGIEHYQDTELGTFDVSYNGGAYYTNVTNEVSEFLASGELIKIKNIQLNEGYTLKDVIYNDNWSSCGSGTPLIGVSGIYDFSVKKGDGNICIRTNYTNYTISYTLSGGTATNPTNYTIETDTFTLNNPTRINSTFAGRVGSNGNTPQTTVSISKGSVGNKNYTAIWTCNSGYELDPNGDCKKSNVQVTFIANPSTFSDGRFSGGETSKTLEYFFVTGGYYAAVTEEIQIPQNPHEYDSSGKLLTGWMFEGRYLDTGYSTTSRWTGLSADTTYTGITLYARYLPFKDKTLTMDGVTFTIMDRNLGALDYSSGYSYGTDNGQSNRARAGLFFQWGNNFGFPNTGTLENTLTGILIENFMTNNRGPGNYYYNGTYVEGTGYRNSLVTGNDNLRGGNDINTSDVNRQGPCPNGYHIPLFEERNSALTLFNEWENTDDGSIYCNSLEQSGYTYCFSAKIGLPFAGHRYHMGYAFTQLRVPGTLGVYRSASPFNEKYVLDLYISNSEIVVNDTSEPARGFSLRCFKDTTGVTLSYDTRGGNDITGSTERWRYAKSTAPANPTRANSTFAGWYRDTGYIQEFVFSGDTYISEDTTIYAKWNCKTGRYESEDGLSCEKYPITVTYDAMDGTLSGGVQTMDVIYTRNASGQYIPDINIQYPNRATQTDGEEMTGWMFYGWYKDTGWTQRWTHPVDSMTETGITVYARYVSFKDKLIKFGDVEFTIMDRNMGATARSSGYFYATGNSAYYGFYYQWGNNFGWISSSSSYGMETTNTRVTLDQEYGPGNYYSSNVFITSTDEQIDNCSVGTNCTWMTENQVNIWGGSSANNPDSDRRGPCPEGYHIPYSSERSASLNLFNKWEKTQDGIAYCTENSGSYGSSGVICYSAYLGLSYGGYGYNNGGRQAAQYQGYYFAANQSSSINVNVLFLYNNNSVSVKNNRKVRGASIRCFKDTTGVTLSYDTKGGTNIPSSTARWRFAKSTAPANPSRTGYTFSGWYKDTGYIDKFTFSNTTYISKDTTLYAKWNLNEYSITYYLDGGTNDEYNPDSYTYESGLFTLFPPSKSGYEFGGWTGSNGDIPEKVVNIPANSTGNRVYYAVWNLIPQISFVDPTPVQDSVITQNRFTTKMNITNADYIKNFEYEYNGTKYDLMSGLVLMYNFDNVESLGESNTVVKDLSNNGYDGVVYGATWTGNGVHGGAYSFDGVDDYIDLPDYDVDDTLKTNGTISVRVKAPYTRRNAIIIVSYNSLGVGFYNGQLIGAVLPNGYSGGAVDNYDNLGWNHLVVSSSGGHISYYINGVKMEYVERVDARYINQGVTIIGKRVYSSDSISSATFSGQIDEIRVYDRALSSDEVQLLYKSNMSKTSENTWEFETLNTCLDASGTYNYTGKVVSSLNTQASTGRNLTTNIPNVSVGTLGYDFGTYEATGAIRAITGTMGRLTVNDYIGKSGWMVYFAASNQLVGQNLGQTIDTENLKFKANNLIYSGLYDGIANSNVIFGNGISTTNFVSAKSSCTNDDCQNYEVVEYMTRIEDPNDFMCGNVGTYSDDVDIKLDIPSYQIQDLYQGKLWITLQQN